MSRLTMIGRSLVLAAPLALGLVLTTAAQDGTPVVDLSPNPEECTLTPRTIEELQALHGTPAAEGAGEATSAALEATPVTFTLPAGTPADAATVEAVTAAVRAGIACYNAGDYLASFGGTTDEFILAQVGLSLFDADFVAAMQAEPVPLPEDQQTQLLGIREVTIYADGRVGALVDYFGPTSPPASGTVETDLWIYENVDGAWLLDEVVENLEARYGPDMTATPAA
jgi:hypothetical protein